LHNDLEKEASIRAIILVFMLIVYGYGGGFVITNIDDIEGKLNENISPPSFDSFYSK
jgi:hypothetical protein